MTRVSGGLKWSHALVALLCLRTINAVTVKTASSASSSATLGKAETGQGYQATLTWLQETVHTHVKLLREQDANSILDCRIILCILDKASPAGSTIPQ